MRIEIKHKKRSLIFAISLIELYFIYAVILKTLTVLFYSKKRLK